MELPPQYIAPQTRQKLNYVQPDGVQTFLVLDLELEVRHEMPQVLDNAWVSLLTRQYYVSATVAEWSRGP